MARRPLPQALRRRKREAPAKPAINQGLVATSAFKRAGCEPIRFPIGAVVARCVPSSRPSSILAQDDLEGVGAGPQMAAEKDKGEGQTPATANNPRADRLKQALRENLKRRKQQAKQRDGLAASEGGGASLHEANGKKPGK
jgi:hypothetical protein